MGPRHLLRGRRIAEVGGGFFCGALKGRDFSEGLVAINDGCPDPAQCRHRTEVDTLFLFLLPPASPHKTEERGIFLPGNWGYLTSSFWEEKNSFARRMIYIYRLSDIDILVYYSKENFFKVRNVNVNKYSNLIIINHDNRWLLHGNLSLKNKSKRKCKTSHRRLIREIYSHVRNKHKKEINLGEKYWRTSCALIKQDPSPLILLSIGRIDLMVERFQRSRGNIFSLHDSRRS